MGTPSPRFYLINDRPAAIVPTLDGGADCVVFSFATGELEPDRSYFGYLTPGSGRDVDVLTEAEFETRLRACRREAGGRSAAELGQWARQLCTPAGALCPPAGADPDIALALGPFARTAGDSVRLDLPPSGYRRVNLAVDRKRAGWVQVVVELQPAGCLLTREVLDAEFRAERELPIFPDSGRQGHVRYHDVTVPGAPAACEVTAQFGDRAAAEIRLSVHHRAA
jgi:hypothetical protein